MAFLGAKTTTFSPLLRLLLILLILPLSTLAQFQFFEQMFNNPSQAQQHAQHSPQQQNVASDSSWYRRNYDGGEPHAPPPPRGPSLYFSLLRLPCLLYYSGVLTWKNIWWKIAYCSNYLCPGTLACVHFPHHCPCAWPAQEDKFELGEGSAVCVSKKGWKEIEVARRVELARKGWIWEYILGGGRGGEGGRAGGQGRW